MGNCLVTRLKGVVDNDNLPKLGVLKAILKVANGNEIRANSCVRVTEGKDTLITILDDAITITGATNGATMVDSKHGYLVNTWNSALQLSGAVENDLVNVEISNKYDFMHLFVSNKSGFDLSELKYSTSMSIFTGSTLSSNPDNTLRGDIADLSELTLLTSLRIGWNKNIYGDITSLGKLTSLTELGIASSQNTEWSNGIRGNWSDFVALQRANGRTTCDGITVGQADYVYVSFGNIERVRFYDTEATISAILKWDATHIDFVASAKKRAYVIGYTQAQVDAMSASGGKYEGYLVFKCD